MDNQKVLLTVRDGPTLHVWIDGKQVAEVRLSWQEVKNLVVSLLMMDKNKP